MPEKLFDIIFRGQLLDGQDPLLVRSQVGRLCNASVAQVEQLFSGRPVAVKKAVDLETAGRFKLAFRRAGAVLDILPHAPSVTTLTMLPPNSGSLEDCALPPPPLVMPNIEYLSIATPGVRLDRTPPPRPVAIDTSDLELIPGQNWTLEDCQAPVVVKLPKVPDLTVAAPGSIIDETPPLPPPLINTANLAFVPVENQNLKDCQIPLPPEPDYDFSGVTLADPIAEDQL